MFLFQPCYCSCSKEEAAPRAITNDEWEPETGALAEETAADLKAPNPEPAAPAAVASLEAAEEAAKARPGPPPTTTLESKQDSKPEANSAERSEAKLDQPRSPSAASKAAAAPTPSSPSRGEKTSSMWPAKRDINCNVFTVELTRPSRDIPFGVTFDRVDKKVLEIVAIDSANPNSVAAAYNKSVDPGRQLLPGRFVMAINGHAGDAKKLEQVWNGQLKVRCEVCQPKEFVIQLDKSAAGAKLGVDIDRSEKGISITVRDISQGLVQGWNDAHPELAVERLDRIVAVNGRRGSSNDMVDALKAANTKLELVIARPDWDVLGP